MIKYRPFPAVCHSAAAAFLAALTLVADSSADIASAAGIERPADAVQVFHSAFDAVWDANFDGWPDRWIRESSIDYPHYVDIQLRDTDDPQSSGGRYLQIDLDGASAAISSPPIRVTSQFSYLLSARLRTSGLKNSTVTLTIAFYNSNGKRIESRSQTLLSRADGWHTIDIGSIDPGSTAIDRAVISLRVEKGNRGDLHGQVCLDDVWLARLPRIMVSTNCHYNVYSDKDDVIVRCELSGIREQNPEIRFQLLDAVGKDLDGGSVHLAGRIIEEDMRKVTDVIDGVGISPKGYEGVSEWRPKIPGYGYYSVVVTMLSSAHAGELSDDSRRLDRRVIWIAVVPPLPETTEGEFGWSLTEGCPCDYVELTGLLPNVCINWLKIPVWYDLTQPQRGDEIIRFVEILSASNIDVVGVLDRPPAGAEVSERLGRNPAIADLFALDPTLWLPSLDGVMPRLSMRLRYWQFGADNDTSFDGFVNLPARIGELRARLFRFGQEVKLGIPWPCDAGGQIPADASWDFEQLSPDPNLSLSDFEKFVSQPNRGKKVRWISVDPPLRPESESPPTPAELETCADTFVRKLVLAKQYGVDGIFVSHPFNDRNGVMRANGMPAELLLPWRTCAAMLGGAKYLGSIDLPNGSENRNFVRPNGEVVMVVWNSEATQEKLYLGDNVRQYDIWGNATTLENVKGEQTVNVGTLPTFVLGVSEPITRWRMALRLEHEHVESIFGVAHPNSVHFKNYFGQGVGGTIAISASRPRYERSSENSAAATPSRPETEFWSIEPPQGSFSLSADQDFTFPFEIRLKNAIFGEQPVRIDFTVEADEPYAFSVYRKMQVGIADLSITMRTHLDKDGSLVVQQTMTNESDKFVDFKCSLRAKGYRPQRAQVYRLGPTPDRKLYRFANGADLLGQQLMLEAEEIGGQRVLKLLFIAKDEPPTQEELSADALTRNQRAARKSQTN